MKSDYISYFDKDDQCVNDVRVDIGDYVFVRTENETSIIISQKKITSEETKPLSKGESYNCSINDNKVSVFRTNWYAYSMVLTPGECAQVSVSYESYEGSIAVYDEKLNQISNCSEYVNNDSISTVFGTFQNDGDADATYYLLVQTEYVENNSICTIEFNNSKKIKDVFENAKSFVLDEKLPLTKDDSNFVRYITIDGVLYSGWLFKNDLKDEEYTFEFDKDANIKLFDKEGNKTGDYYWDEWYKDSRPCQLNMETGEYILVYDEKNRVSGNTEYLVEISSYSKMSEVEATPLVRGQLHVISKEDKKIAQNGTYYYIYSANLDAKEIASIMVEYEGYTISFLVEDENKNIVGNFYNAKNFNGTNSLMGTAVENIKNTVDTYYILLEYDVSYLNGTQTASVEYDTASKLSDYKMAAIDLGENGYSTTGKDILIVQRPDRVESGSVKYRADEGTLYSLIVPAQTHVKFIETDSGSYAKMCIYKNLDEKPVVNEDQLIECYDEYPYYYSAEIDNKTDEEDIYYVWVPSGCENINITAIKSPIQYLVKTIYISAGDIDITKLLAGQEVNLDLTIEPDDAADKTVTWSSSNTKVATVDATGKVKAIAEGTATITATAKDGSGVTGSLKITVVKPQVEAPKAVSNLSAVAAGKEKVRLTWTKSDKADGYLIYAKKNGTYGYCGVANAGTQTSYTDTKAIDTDYNFYWVYPFKYDANGKRVIGKCTKYVYAKGICTATENVKASSVKGGVKLTWSKKAGASGYLIYGKKTGGKYGYVGMTKGYGATSYTDKGALKSAYNFYWVIPYHYSQSGKLVAGQTGKYVYGKAK